MCRGLCSWCFRVCADGGHSESSKEESKRKKENRERKTEEEEIRQKEDDEERRKKGEEEESMKEEKRRKKKEEYNIMREEKEREEERRREAKRRKAEEKRKKKETSEKDKGEEGKREREEAEEKDEKVQRKGGEQEEETGEAEGKEKGMRKNDGLKDDSDERVEEGDRGPRPTRPRPYWIDHHDDEMEPYATNRKQMYARTGFNLQIHPDGSVRGTREPYSPFAVLDFTAVAVGEVQMKGAATNLYVAMNRSGLLYGESDPTEEGTIWIERGHGLYMTYLSKKYAHRGWYMAIKKSGKAKKGSMTWWRQKAIQFLHRPSREH
ncbi:unnamed protein product [Darwinula stevensoni]|uniref:Fibroblast growth factor n=1 Tax=Darwinula stevensoni TaxID=69355 RepID=A0A7R8XEC9_9CRUS|nr:unnamed protein product [Darwinula stevensoni]CAG0887700.1 unnamed protein product [Darwinula stevensoni]